MKKVTRLFDCLWSLSINLEGLGQLYIVSSEWHDNNLQI